MQYVEEMLIPPALRALASPHRAALEATFGPMRPDPAAPPPPSRMLFLCFTNRCGSNYLAQLLASTGAFNEAGEFFNAATVLEHAAARALRSLPAYVATLPSLVPPHTILAAKAAPDQLVMLADAGILDAVGPRATYLLLERQDQLAQAISRVIASQNNAWSSTQTPTIPPSALLYDRAAIETELHKITHANAAFYVFFAANNITPLHTTYEAVLQNPQALASELSQRLAMPNLHINPATVQLRRQSGPVNVSWQERFQTGK
jgi:LPS sulfotransferase NodH